MNFFSSGFIGLGAELARKPAKQISDETAAAIFGTRPAASKPLFGFTDKVLLTIGLTILGVAWIKMAVK